MSLRDRGFIITGAGRGLGQAIAVECARNGASLFLCGRDTSSLTQTVALCESARPGDDQVIRSMTANVSVPAEVDALVERAVAELPVFTGLVNNAGVYGPKGRIEDNDWSEWVAAIEINLLGTVYTTRAALPHLRGSGYGKILNLSGGGATAPLPRLSAYAASKAAVVRFTETVAHETGADGIDVNALAPGALNTTMLDEVLAAGPDVVGLDFYERAAKQKASGGTPLSRGAECTAWALSAASDGITGRLISAVWDPWATLAEHRDEIAKGDIYTLRRIVPADRGAAWGDV